MNRVIIILALLLAAAFTGSAFAAEDAKWVEKLEIIKKARAIYEENCAACHGFDGNSVLPEAPNFAKGERLDKKEEELLKTIKEGKGELMPPWKDVINEDEMKSMILYARAVTGDKLFEEICLECHSQSIPPLNSKTPSNDKLKDLTEPINICSKTNIDDEEMEVEEIAGVVRFVRALKREK
ncbi:MAG: cytochrome c [Deltaproteobacteria bacterium]|nr:cytochrome c [Deltaproteobacteria bacterium]